MPLSSIGKQRHKLQITIKTAVLQQAAVKCKSTGLQNIQTQRHNVAPYFLVAADSVAVVGMA